MSKTALLFAGQGSQSVGMGKDFAESPIAREWFGRADDILGYDLTRICLEGPEAELTRTVNAQPGIFLVGWVAFQMLKERVPGLAFEATAGLSLGEFTALAAAEVLRFEDAIHVVRERGRFMQEACDETRGGMAAIIGLDEAATRAVCVEAGVELANLNCPGQIVISGENEPLAHACTLAKAAGAKKAMPLTVAGAYHSRLMKSAQPRLEASLGAIAVQAPRWPVISNVTAQPHGPADEIRQRLVEQVTAPVRWEDSIRFLLRDGFTRFIELGPGKALSGFMKRIEPGAQMLAVSDLPTLAATVVELGK